MKMPPEYVKAAINMQPGKIVKTGFFGDDTRPLSDIIQNDEESMEKLGLDFDAISEKLEHLMYEGIKGLGEPITVDRIFLVRIDEARGRLPCPFQDKINLKRTALVKNIDTGEEFYYSELSIHLIKAHHFFQGKGSPFRIEPEVIKRILEL